MALTAKFTQGNIPQQVTKMTLTNAVGLSVFFLVDLIDLYFISTLNQPELLAAIAYAVAVIFFTSAFNIALVIANSAVIGRNLGLQQYEAAKRLALLCNTLTLICSTLLTIVFFCYAEQLLRIIGAKGNVLIAATQYLEIVIISFPLFALAMQILATLRVLGKAKIAMMCLLYGGFINICLTPLFIFYFQLSIEGAAIATVLTRIVILSTASYYLYKKLSFVAPLKPKFLRKDISQIIQVALPAALTQIVTPMGHLFVTYEIAQFGESFVAGWAVVSRLIPSAFILLFAMPGAIGPMISQNLGAKRFNRVTDILNHAISFILKYVLVAALSLSLLQEYIVLLFNAQSDAATLIRFFCQYIAFSFIFVAINLMSMSFLNNIGFPKTATMLNLSKLILGTIPFVTLGAYYYGAEGVLMGQAISNILFAFIALIYCFRTLNKLAMH